MLNKKQLEKLKANWGSKAEALDCFAEVRIYDPLSSWECYILAVNPEEEDEIICIISGTHVEVCVWNLNLRLFNSNGEKPHVDTEYRPRLASEVLKKLMGKQAYDTYRD